MVAAQGIFLVTSFQASIRLLQPWRAKEIVEAAQTGDRPLGEAPTARRRARHRTRPRSRGLTRQTPCGGTTNVPRGNGKTPQSQVRHYSHFVTICNIERIAVGSNNYRTPIIYS